MYGYESWTIKKAECRRIDACKLWCWRRLLRVPWIARRSNQFILKEISSECSLEGLMLKLKLQYFGHLMWRADSLEKTLMLGKFEGGRRREQQRWDGGMPSLIQWAWVWVNSGSWWWTGRPGLLPSMRSQRVGHDWVTELNWSHFSCFYLFATLPTVSCQASLSIRFSKQEHWSGLPFPFPGDLPDPGIELASLLSPALVGGFFTSWATREAPSIDRCK